MIAHFMVFVCVSLSLQLCLGFAFYIEIKPNTVNGLVHNDVSIACRLSDDDVKEIAYINVFKQGQAVAIFRQDSRLSIAKGLEDHFKAEGKLQNPTSDSYLNVLMSNPTMEDSGEYTCILYYLDETSVLKEKKKNANFTVNNQEVKSTLRYLVDELTMLKSELVREKNDSRHRESELQQKIDSQETQLINQREEFQLHESKEKKTVTFTAYHNAPGHLSVGDVLIFNDVTTNEGQGYNGVTGVFKTPIAGYYVFHISVAIKRNQHMYLDLVSSKGQKLPRMMAGEHQWQEATSGSCVVKLEVGEEIKPVLRYAYHNPTVYHYQKGDPFSQFTGYLLKAI